MTVPYTFANQTGPIPLAELDANFAAVPNYANAAGRVVENSQPNITSVGTLTSVTSTGNITGNYFIGNGSHLTGVIASGGTIDWANIGNISNQNGPSYIWIGTNAGDVSNVAIDTIAIGNSAGNNFQGTNAISLGSFAGSNTQGVYSIAVGRLAASTAQGGNSIAIGHSAGNNNQGANVVSIGYLSGNLNSGDDSIAIGTQSGYNTQGNGAVAIGRFAGNNTQGANSVALGRNSGNLFQGNEAVAIGHSAGNNNQGFGAVAIGAYAGNNFQGANSIAIGAYAGYPTVANNSIIINGLDVPFAATNAGLYIAPIRNITLSNISVLQYNSVDSEIVASNSLALSGNVSANYFIGNGSQLTGISAGNVVGAYGNSNVAAYMPTYNGALGSVSTVTATGNIVGSTILSTGVVSANGNVRGGNINTTGLITATGNVTGGNITTVGLVTATGNIAGSYFIGNGAFLTGVSNVGMASRTQITITTPSLAANAAANIIVNGFKGYALYSIQSNAGAWVTVYTSNAAAVSDYTRTINTDPTPGSGVIAEAVSNVAATTNFTPGVLGFNLESPPTTAIPIKVVNNDSVTGNISVTFTLLQTEQ